MNFNKSRLLLSVVVLFFTFFSYSQSNSKFRVILDAGHGGKDFGSSHHGNVEKRIVLGVVLKVGAILEKEPGVEVVYTRKSDVFVGVRERSVIANKKKGDVFVSVHCNGAGHNDASGSETYVMGVSKNKSNLEVAKKENAAITLEDDYKTKYAGFDPNSPESLIGLTLIQEDYLDQSIDLATKVQNGFTKDLKRKNRGVKQGPFWVLHGVFMPSILIELGFVSNKTEGAYLTSEKGQNELAKSIAKGIINYKKGIHNSNSVANNEKNVEKPSSTNNSTPVKTTESTTEKTSNKGVVFKVQISASPKNLPLKPSNFKGLNKLSVIKEGNLYKYYYSETTNYNRSKEDLKLAKDKGFPSSFIVPFKDGKKITLKEALK